MASAALREKEGWPLALVMFFTRRWGCLRMPSRCLTAFSNLEYLQAWGGGGQARLWLAWPLGNMVVKDITYAWRPEASTGLPKVLRVPSGMIGIGTGARLQNS